MRTYIVKMKDHGHILEYTFAEKKEAHRFAGRNGGKVYVSIPRNEMTDEDIWNYRIDNVTKDITVLSAELGISREEFVVACERVLGYKKTV